MKKLLTVILTVLVSVFAQAQAAKDSVIIRDYRENVFRATVNRVPYEYIPGPQTPAPKGYKAFYISHYGRHGSRSSNSKTYAERLEMFQKAHDMGLLTAEGEAILERIKETIRLHNGMDGRLTPIGQQEHRQIARRMYQNNKSVFTQGSKKIFAVSSYVPRCLVSMSSACSELSALQPDLDILFDTGETLQKYISSGHSSSMKKKISKMEDEYYRTHLLDTVAFCSRVFTSPKAAKKLGSSLQSIMRGVWEFASAGPAFGLDDSLYRLFTEDDRYLLAQRSAMHFYMGQCNSVEFGDERLPRAYPIVDDIVTRADAAIATGEYCADLRFGHDYQLLTLASILGFKGVAERLDKEQATRWNGWRYTPFAGNIQLIFYRNKAGKVLVKPLMNEREIPLLDLPGGPYYEWDALKEKLGYGPKRSISWTEGEAIDKRHSNYRLDIENPPAGTGWTVWFNQFRTPVTIQDGSDGTIEHVAGTLYRIIPLKDTKGGTFHIGYSARTLVNRGRAPEGFYLEIKGMKPKAVKADYKWQPAQGHPSFKWTHTGDFSPEDMIPRLKSVTKGSALTAVPEKFASVDRVEGQKPGWYRIVLQGGKALLEAADSDAEYWASVTLANIREAAGASTVEMTIEDWPDLPYRGLMLDVSRNFTSKENILKLLDLLARYKVNVFHLHMGDDEGWRVAIDGLPELTSYGAFRGLPVLNADGSISEPDALMPTYCTTPDRFDRATTGNGYYSHRDFVEILRYANQRHIHVVPEFDSPGHSRAAIKAMEYRARTTGDESCLLSEPSDTSRYVSVQDYTDNAINVALPSTYRFIEKVFDSLIAMYKEAGAPLDAIHVGGDEVPEGAWIGSPACRALMEKNGWKGTDSLKDYFLNRVMDIAESRGVRIAGWQEVCVHLEPATLERLKKNLAFTNVWTVSRGREELPYQFANQGIPVVISSAPNAYFDLAYNDSKLERGHSWAGLVDERRSFSLQPFDMYRSVRYDDHGHRKDIASAPDGKTALENAGAIKGVQGQLWTETIRNFDHVTYYLFPKALGLFERGWNATPSWQGTTKADDPAFLADFDRFYTIIYDREIPYYKSIGISYHTN